MTDEIEVEAPDSLFREEEDPSIVEGGGRDDNNDNDENENVDDGVPQQKTWYSRTIGKVAILLLAVFAVNLAIGYGSGYGIAEKVHSNKAAAAAVSSAKNSAFETYDTPTSAAKASKNGGSGAAKSAKSTGPTSDKSAKSSAKSSKSGCGIDCPTVSGSVALGCACCSDEVCAGYPFNACRVRAQRCITNDPLLDCSAGNSCTVDSNNPFPLGTCTGAGEFCGGGEIEVERCTPETRIGKCVDNPDR